MRSSTIDFIVTPKSKSDLNLSKIHSVRELLKIYNLDHKIVYDQHVFTNEHFEIYISSKGTIMCSLVVGPENTRQGISALNDISNKIVSIISENIYDIYREVFILDHHSLLLEKFLSDRNDFDEITSVSFETECGAKIAINRGRGRNVLSFLNFKHVEDIISAYSSIIQGIKIEGLTRYEAKYCEKN